MLRYIQYTSMPGNALRKKQSIWLQSIAPGKGVARERQRSAFVPPNGVGFRMELKSSIEIKSWVK